MGSIGYIMAVVGGLVLVAGVFQSMMNIGSSDLVMGWGLVGLTGLFVLMSGVVASIAS